MPIDPVIIFILVFVNQIKVSYKKPVRASYLLNVLELPNDFLSKSTCGP
jgi:hypothetical protein